MTQFCWCSSMLWCNLATNVRLNISTSLFVWGRYFVVVTNLVPIQGHSSAMNLNVNCSPLSVRTLSEMQSGITQILEAQLQSVGYLPSWLELLSSAQWNVRHDHDKAIFLLGLQRKHEYLKCNNLQRSGKWEQIPQLQLHLKLSMLPAWLTFRQRTVHIPGEGRPVANILKRITILLTPRCLAKFG